MTRQRLHAQQAVTPACISSWYHHDVINIIMMSSISSWRHRYRAYKFVFAGGGDASVRAHRVVL